MSLGPCLDVRSHALLMVAWAFAACDGQEVDRMVASHGADDLGTGGSTTEAAPVQQSVTVDANLGRGSGASYLAAGDRQLCWLDDTRTLVSYVGVNEALGLSTAGPAEPFEEERTVSFSLGGPVSQLALGLRHGCALLETGDVICWGDNSRGQLGVGDTAARVPDVDELSSVQLGGGVRVQSITAAGDRSCALLAGGDVKCWGSGVYGPGTPDIGNVGDEPNEMGDALAPLDLGADLHAAELTASTTGICIAFEDDSLKCWGTNNSGQLGQGDTQARGDEPDEWGDQLTPFRLGPGQVSHLQGGYEHYCALVSEPEGRAQVKCWGWNGSGQLGLGDTDNRGDEPDEMGDALPPARLGDAQPADVAVGFAHSCALFDDGRVKCWGEGARNLLGTGKSNVGDTEATVDNAMPTLDFGDQSVVQLVAADHFSCVRFENGEFACWGEWEIAIRR